MLLCWQCVTDKSSKKELKMASSCVSSSPHSLSIPTRVRENRRISTMVAMLFPSSSSSLPFLLLPPILFKCFCASTSTQSLPTPSEKWEPFLKKKVVMRVGYVGTNFRGYPPQLFLFSFKFYFFSEFLANFISWGNSQVCRCNEMNTDYPVRPFFSVTF